MKQSFKKGSLTPLFCLMVFVGCYDNDLLNPHKPNTNNAHKEEVVTESQDLEEELFTVDPSSAENFKKHEDENCKPLKEKGVWTESDCQDDLICLPDIYKPEQGHCRLPCKDSPCPKGRSCQTANNLKFKPMGQFCLSKQQKRDGLCHAPFSENACSKNRACVPNEIMADKEGNPITSHYMCRNVCPLDSDEADIACPGSEVCRKLFGKVGVCVKEVPWVEPKDFENGFSGQFCNEATGHEFCNRSLTEGLTKPPTVQCMPISKKSTGGICMSICSMPALDMDQDGKISPSEAGAKLNCPKDFECSTELGEKIGLVRFITGPNPDGSKSVRKSCDLKKCTKAKPCPAECGPGDAQCLEKSTKSGTFEQLEGFCGAPLGNCISKS